MTESAEKKTLRDALRVVFRRWPVFLVASSAFAVVVIWASHYMPLKYTGTAYFERRMDPAVDNLGNASFEGMKQTLIQRLRGREAVEQVIEQLGLTKGLPHAAGELTSEGNKAKQDLVAGFQRDLGISFQVQTPAVDLVSVDFTHQDADLASKVPNLLVANYTEWVHQNIYDRLAASSKFLGEQEAKCKRRLDELEKQKLDFEVQHAGSFPESPNALQSQINALQSDLDTVQMQQTKANTTVARLEAMSGKAPPTQPDEARTESVRKLSSIELEYARLLDQVELLRADLQTAIMVRRYTELHPEVRTLRASIANLDARLREIEPRLPKGYEPVTAKSVAFKGENVETALAAARSEVEVTTAEIQKMDNRLRELQSLMSNYTVVRQQYVVIMDRIRDQAAEATRWKTRQDEIQMALDAEVAKRRTHLESVQTAEKQFRPSSPKLMMILGLAYFGGLAFGGGVVFLINHLDRSIRTTEDAIQHFNVPVHGVIGEIATSKSRRRTKIRRYLLRPAATVVVFVALIAATLSITLWLKAPDTYQNWKAAPVQFVVDHVGSTVGDLWDRLRS